MPNYTDEHAQAGIAAKLPQLETCLAESIPGIRDYDAVSRILFRVPEDRASRLRNHHNSLQAA